MDCQRAAFLACAQCSWECPECRGVCAHQVPRATAEGDAGGQAWLWEQCTFGVGWDVLMFVFLMPLY